MGIAKIISGGQTGVDRGALEAALELGFPYGGLIPKGRKAEDGQVPTRFDKMEVSSHADYLFRTEWNVTHSDATLIIARRTTPDSDELTGGTLKTYEFASVHAKPCLVVFNANIDQVVNWLEKVSARLGKQEIVLNIVGQRESKANGIQLSTKIFVRKLLRRYIPWGQEVKVEYCRQKRLREMLKYGGLSCSLEEIKRGIEELKQAKIKYFLRFETGCIPYFMTDADDIEAQVRLGVPFPKGTRDDECVYCGRMHLSCNEHEDPNRYYANCPFMNNDCPDDKGYLDGLTIEPSLLEARFIVWFRRVNSAWKKSWHDLEMMENAEFVKEAQRGKEEWIQYRCALQRVLDVRSGSRARVEWNLTQLRPSEDQDRYDQKWSDSEIRRRVEYLWMRQGEGEFITMK